MHNLIDVLAQNERISLCKLTELLQCSEHLVLKQIAELEAQGIVIEKSAVDFRLIPQLARLDEAYLNHMLAPQKLIIKPVIHSTNQYLLDHIHQLETGTLCLAEYQTAGRGRRGRQWLSPFAGQIIMSMYWTVERTTNLEGLSLVVGMAIADTLKQFGAIGVTLKWPNDVLLNNRKLAGILIEIANSPNRLHNLVIGLGINLSLPKQQNSIDQPWAELIEVLPDIDRNQLIIVLVKNLTFYLDYFKDKGIDDQFKQRWLELDAYLGEEVSIISENHRTIGVEQGIDERGYIKIMTSEGVQYFNGGEVSLRKV
ncbi:MAG: bifunctional biotin--[acetyl-CoA-carboxylase] ligase/biotin operon repressor BirA [Pasteurella oralis]|uniref:bifunctional biotin--[acetyl-CoA-carboxylase] ligase/biotin operon repressor BirA n=1 Tax=Pasteurella oralis TaxID=1071947 RepID=UPI0027103401|nr:bifunctional biotin--[acetyl-CoA-carboxylase] ligase/biotin operon repressor BirA [Pasteurella oralis]